MVKVSFNGGFTMKSASDLSNDEMNALMFFINQVDPEIIKRIKRWSVANKDALLAVCDKSTFFKLALENVDGDILIDCRKLNFTVNGNLDNTSYIIDEDACENLCITI